MRQAYDTDLTDQEWEIIMPMLPKPFKLGSPATVNKREILNGIFYILKNGCTWENLPHDLPAYSTVYLYFRRWTMIGLMPEINQKLSERLRIEDGREATASLASLDSQTVKTTESSESRGYNGGKKIKGRKRHIIVDTLGLLIGVVVHTADIAERAGAKLLLESLKYPLARLKKILVDKGYSGADMTDWVKENFDWIWEVSKSPDKQKEFIPESKRWIVERTFAWLGKCRRLSKDYEYHEKMSESFIYLALIRIMLRNLTPVNS